MPKPCTKVWVPIPTSFSADGFTAGARTAFHITWTKAQAESLGYTLRVPQGCYHTGYKPSAGTHDKDEVLDMVLYDAHGRVVPGKTQNHFFRFRCYWWGWWRTPTQGFPYHFHGISSRAHHCAVGDYVPGQLVDWKNKALGLKGLHTPGCDPMPYPDSWKTRYFPYRQLLEDDMAWNDWPKKDQTDMLDAIARRIMAEQMNLKPDGDADFTDMSVRDTLKKITRKVSGKN